MNRYFKKIILFTMMLSILGTAGLLPISLNLILANVKSVEAATAAEIDRNTELFLQSRTGKLMNGTYGYGIYQQVYNQTKDEAKARAAADTAYEHLKPAARTLVESETNRNKDAQSAEFYRANYAIFNKLLTDEQYSNSLITDSKKQENYTEIDKNVEALKELDDRTPEQKQADHEAAMQAQKDLTADMNDTFNGGGRSMNPDSPNGAIKCNILLGEIMGCFAEVSYMFLKLCALFLSIVAAFFNLTLNFTLNIGKFIPRTGLGDLGLGGSAGAIYVGWSTIRDFINVAFIFVLLFASINIILGNDKYGLKTTITKVVIAAILLNFSLFFTKVIIDLSNIIALQFYSRILDASGKADGKAESIDGGLSAGLQNAIGLSGIWSGKNSGNSAQEYNNSIGNIGPYQLIVVCVFGGIFILVFAFVLFMATVQFIFRSIVLLFLMMTSPVGFLGGAIPGLENISKDWWQRLKNNAIFAPAYTAIMYIACQMIFGGSKSGLVSGSNIKDFLIQDKKSNGLGIAFWFALVIGFLLAAQVGARKFADSFGSSYVAKAEKWFKGLPQFGLKYSGANAAARNTVGNVGRALSENRVVKKLATTPIVRQLGGQSIYNSIKNLQSAKIGGKSYKDVIDERVKRDQTTFERLGETTTRKGVFETEQEFKTRETKAKNAATKARAKFMGINTSMGSGNFDSKVVKDEDGVDIPTREISFSKQALKDFKNKTRSTYGAGYRKSRKEVLKQASGFSKKGSPENIEKQIEKAEKDLEDTKDYHDAEIADKQGVFDRVRERDPAVHAARITADNVYRRDWMRAMKALDKAKAEKDKKQEKIDALYRQLRQAQNSQDKK